MIDTNLASVFYTCRAVARGDDEARAASIVNISSIVGVHGNWGQTNYAASKAGIIGFTKSLARELGSRNVRANVVAPGYVKTQLTDVLPEEATQRDAREHAARPARRSGGRRRGGTLPLLRRGRRSSRARCCSSTADWGCSDGRRATTDGAGSSSPALGHGDAARQRRRVDVGEPGRGRVRRGPRSRSSTRRDYDVHFACELKDFEPTTWIDRKQARRMDRFAQLVARGRAHGRGGLRASTIAPERRPRRRGDRDRDRRPRRRSRTATTSLIERGPDRVNPFSIVQIIPNMGAGWVSMELGTHGPLAVAVHRLRRLEHGDRRRARRDPARPRGRDVLRRHRGADHARSASPASARCARSRAATTIPRRRRGRSTPSATAS